MNAPARNYTWPAFEAGNTAAVTHGARSARVVAPLAAAIEAEALQAAPWTQPAVFAPTLRAWAWAEAQCQLMRAHFDERGLFDDKGLPRPGLADLERAERRRDRLAQQLGLSPSSWVALRRAAMDQPSADSSEGVAALIAVGRQITEAAHAAGEGQS